MTMNERWLDRPPQEMLETFHFFAGEAFAMIVDDLAALPKQPPIVCEGFRLLPRLVAPLLSRRDQALWLIPTPEFRRWAFDERGSTYVIPNKTSDPERALANLLARDDLFTRQLANEASELQLQTISVVLGQTTPETTALVAESLGLADASGLGRER